MTLSHLISKIKPGTVHVILFKCDTGEIILKTIWHNAIPEEYKEKEIGSIEVDGPNYIMKVGIYA